MTFLSQEELFYSDDRNKLDSKLDLNNRINLGILDNLLPSDERLIFFLTSNVEITYLGVENRDAP